MTFAETGDFCLARDVGIGQIWTSAEEEEKRIIKINSDGFRTAKPVGNK